MIARSKDLYVN